MEKNNPQLQSRSENLFNFLMGQMLQRVKIDESFKRQRRRNRRGSKPQQSVNTCLNDVQKGAMEKTFNALIQSLEKEGLSFVDHNIIKNVGKAKKLVIEDHNWEDARKDLVKSVESVKPFDIEKLVECYGEFSHVSNKLRDENLVLFIGRTGSGKSTTIHFLKGTKFRRDPKHATHFIPDNDNDVSDDLKHIKLDYQVNQSVTKYMTPVRISLGENRVILCDTPGIGDSRGIEVEVANSLSLIHAIRGANSVCIVLVLSDEEKASRSEIFKHTGRYVTKLLDHYKSKKCHIATKLKDIGIIFTKFSDEDEIWDFFDSYIEPTNANVDGYYLAKKIANQSDLILINPINSNCDDVTSQLFGDASVGGAKWITDTKQQFKDEIPSKSFILIKNQVRIDIKSIEYLSSTVRHNRCDNFDLIEGKLNNLKKLSMILKSQMYSFIRADLEGAVKKVEICWTKICNTIRKNMENQDNLTLETVNNNIGKARKMIVDVLQQHSRLQSKYLEQAPSSQQMVYELYKNGFCKILEKVDFSCTNKNTAASDAKNVSCILKCLIIITHFYDESRFSKLFIKLMDELLSKCVEAIEQNEFSFVRQFLDVITSTKEKWLEFVANCAVTLS